MIGSDDGVLDPESDTHFRQARYADILAETEPDSTLHVLCHTDGEAETRRFSDRLVGHGSGSFRRETFAASIIRHGHRIVADEDIGLILTQTPVDDGLAGSVLARLADVPVMAQHHSPFFDDPRWLADQPLGQVKRLLFRFSKGRFDAIRVVSRAALDWYLQQGVPRERLYHNPVSVNLPEATTDVSFDTGAHLLYVGRIIPRKGIETLLDAVGLVREDHPDTRLHVVGSGDDGYRSQLRDRAARLGIDDAVTFHGFVPEAELAAYYEAADVTVVPSLLEPYGRVSVESLSRGTPVVSTDTVGARDIVGEDRWGYVVPKEDAETMAARVGDLVGDLSTAARMGERGREYVLSEHNPAELRRDWVAIWRAVAHDDWSIRSPHGRPFTPPEEY